MRRLIAIGRIYIERVNTWASLAQKAILLWLLSADLERRYGWDAEILAPLLTLGAIMGVFVLGYIMDKARIYDAEETYLGDRRAQYAELAKAIRELRG